MTEVAHSVRAQSKCSEKCQHRHEDDHGTHAHGDRQGENIDSAIRKQNRTSDKNSKNSSGGANRRGVSAERNALAQKRWKHFDNDVDEPSSHARQKVIAQEAILSPNKFEFPAKHPEHEHVHEDVPDAIHVMEEQVSKGLPDVKQGDDTGRD